MAFQAVAVGKDKLGMV